MSNWETKGVMGALTGTETIPGNQGGITKYCTINMIKAFIAAAFEAAGAVAAGIAGHLAAYAHGDIAHINRDALDLVSGTNTGDQDLSAYAPLNNPHFSGNNNIFDCDVVINGCQFGVGVGTGNFNTRGGNTCLNNNTTGSDNTAFGFGSLSTNTTGSYNTGLGSNALHANSGGGYNVAVGYFALVENTVGSNNVAVGVQAGRDNVEGSDNVAIGKVALRRNQSGNSNVAVGSAAIYNNIYGSNNVAIGDSAGYSLSTDGFASNNVFIGKYAGRQANFQKSDVQNSICVGADTYTTKDNQVVIGDANISETQLRGNVITPAHSTGLVTNVTATLAINGTTTSVIANYAGTTTLTLPDAASFSGRLLRIRTIQSQSVISDASNVIPLAGGSASTAILAATAGKWAMLQSDGTNWHIMQAN